MACNTSNIKEMKYGRPQTVMFTAGDERPNGVIVNLGVTQETVNRALDHVHTVTRTTNADEVIGKYIVIAPEINVEQYRRIDGQMSNFTLKDNETYTAYELSKLDRIEYTFSTDYFEGDIATFPVGGFVTIDGQGKFAQNPGGNATNSAFRVVSIVDTHVPFVLAPNTAPDQPGKLLPTAGKKIKLEVVR